MRERQMPPSSPPVDVPEAVRIQILATEHWSLLAARNIAFGAIFSRTSIFLTVVSAAVVALALVAQATEFGDEFQLFALLVLPVALFIGVTTHIRVSGRPARGLLARVRHESSPSRLSRDRTGA